MSDSSPWQTDLQRGDSSRSAMASGLTLTSPLTAEMRSMGGEQSGRSVGGSGQGNLRASEQGVSV